MSINRSETLDSKLMIKQRYRSKKALHVYRVCIYIYIYIAARVRCKPQEIRLKGMYFYALCSPEVRLPRRVTRS